MIDLEIANGAQMTCSRQKYTFPSHYSGDTFAGTVFTIRLNDAPLDLTGASIDFTFIHETNSNYTYSLTSDDEITITNNTGGVFQIDQQIINWYPGLYNYDMTITTNDSGVFTWIYGTWSILNGN